MTTGAIILMTVSVTSVTVLMVWCYKKVFSLD